MNKNSKSKILNSQSKKKLKSKAFKTERLSSFNDQNSINKMTEDSLNNSNREFSLNEAQIGYSDLSESKWAKNFYLDRVKSKIERNKFYPKASKVLKESGLVKIRVTLNKNGQIQKIEIVESSQFSRLDQAAVRSIALAGPFDSFPLEITYNSWSLLIPIRFELN